MRFLNAIDLPVHGQSNSARGFLLKYGLSVSYGGRRRRRREYLQRTLHGMGKAPYGGQNDNRPRNRNEDG